VCVFTTGPAEGGTNRAIRQNSGILRGRHGVARCRYDRTRSRVVGHRLIERIFALGDDAVPSAAGDVANSALDDAIERFSLHRRDATTSRSCTRRRTSGSCHAQSSRYRDHHLADEAMGFRRSHQAAKQASTCSAFNRAKTAGCARRAGDVILNLRAIARVCSRNTYPVFLKID
jgi:hypothetical protein